MSYYIEQAGSGISGYSGSRYQHGYGFLGKIFKKLKPALKYFGREGIKTASAIGRDLLNGENFIESAKANIVNTGKNIMTDAIGRAEEYVKQNGNGLKRKRVCKKTVKRRKVAKKKSTKTIKRPKPKRVIKRKKVIDFF
jgi:hypothetical protein